MLVREIEATNQLILENDLVGVIDDNAITVDTVNIIKNRYNGVMGKVPLFLYKQLEEDYNEAKAKAEKAKPKMEHEPEDDHNDFAAFSELNSILDMFNQVANSPKAKMTDAAKDLNDILSNGNSKMDRIKREFAKRAIKKEAQVKMDQGKEVIDEIGTTLSNIFGDIVDGFDDFVQEITPTVDQATQDIKDTVNQLGIRSDLAKLRAVRDYAIEEQVATKGFLKKINAKIIVLEQY